MVPVGDGSGLMRSAMLSGMLMVSGEICGCTGFTGDSGASRRPFFPLDRAVNVILMVVLGNLNVHLRTTKRRVVRSFVFREQLRHIQQPQRENLMMSISFN